MDGAILARHRQATSEFRSTVRLANNSLIRKGACVLSTASIRVGVMRNYRLIVSSPLGSVAGKSLHDKVAILERARDTASRLRVAVVDDRTGERWDWPDFPD